MNRKHLHGLGAVVAVALLALGSVGMALAHDEEKEELTLTGLLSQNDQGEYVLIEQESGDSIPLKSRVDLDEYADQMVNVTGNWSKQRGDKAYFEVSRIERAS